LEEDRYSKSPDWNYLAYTIEAGGSDYKRIRLWDLKNNKSMEGDEIKGVKFSHPVWSKDSKGFTYAKHATPANHNFSGHTTEGLHFDSLYYHKVGTEQKDDIILF
jgi:prolyl oligopeptidase